MASSALSSFWPWLQRSRKLPRRQLRFGAQSPIQLTTRSTADFIFFFTLTELNIWKLLFRKNRHSSLRKINGGAGSVDFQSFGTGDRNMMKFRKMLKDTKGATAIEYGLIAALIAVAAITAMSGLGTELNKTLNKVKTRMETSNT
jgi:pilus assembly protein Flp/PilA